MDQADDSFEGLAQGTLDWINDTFTLFHSGYDALDARLDEGSIPSQISRDRLSTIVPSDLIQGHDLQRDAYINRNLESSHEVNDDAIHHSLAVELAGSSQQSPFMHGARGRMLRTQHPLQSSCRNFQFPSTVPPSPSPSTTTPPSSTYAYGPLQESVLPSTAIPTEGSLFDEQRSYYSNIAGYGARFPEAQDAVSHSMRTQTLPTPTFTNHKSSDSNRSPSNTRSTPNYQSNRSVEPVHHQRDVSSRRRHTDPHFNAIPHSPLNPNPPHLMRQSITWPPVDANDCHNEQRRVPQQILPAYESLYATSLQAPFPIETPATTLRPNPAPIRIKTEPPDRSSLQSVFHSLPDLTSPARAHALEKNRLAARKSRSKKRDYVEDLAAQSREYTVENRRLRSKVDELRQEMKGLRDTIRLHKDCGGWTGEMQAGVESYLKRVDERQEAEEQNIKKENSEIDEDLQLLMDEYGG